MILEKSYIMFFYLLNSWLDDESTYKSLVFHLAEVDLGFPTQLRIYYALVLQDLVQMIRFRLFGDVRCMCPFFLDLMARKECYHSVWLQLIFCFLMKNMKNLFDKLFPKTVFGNFFSKKQLTFVSQNTKT